MSSIEDTDRARYAEAALRVLREPYVGRGKLEVLPKVVARNLDDIALLYTPGVGYAVNKIVARGLARRKPAPGAVAAHTKALREMAALRQAFVAERTPAY